MITEFVRPGAKSSASLTATQIDEIRALPKVRTIGKDPVYTDQWIAKKYGITISEVSAIRHPNRGLVAA